MKDESLRLDSESLREVATAFSSDFLTILAPADQRERAAMPRNRCLLSVKHCDVSVTGEGAPSMPDVLLFQRPR